MDDSNFFAMDRLMEFGLSMGMANQMVNMMNQNLQNVQIPENARPVLPKAVEWYAVLDGKPNGPFTEKEMKGLLLDKKLSKDTLVWSAGMSAWQPVESTMEIQRLILQLPPTL